MLALCSPMLPLSCLYVDPMLAYIDPILPLCWPYVRLCYPYLASMLTLCWRTLTLSCPMLPVCWPKLPLSCPYINPMFTYVGLGNALPHSSDRNDGGGEGVGTGWGGGHPKLGRRLRRQPFITFGYYRRPPARTRTWDVARRPDLRATPMPPTPHPTRGWCQRWRAGEVVKVACRSIKCRQGCSRDRCCESTSPVSSRG